ncbi:MAG: HDOD domain-containing protein [Desulfatitalea sp.]|nr:HDOD domain-containing protein [Desulfatitalea sp.]NNK00653.1 HDOD domain-containing protein [Desulfatitalea sp.]
MKIKCLGCDKVLVIPDNRLPRDKAIAFPCPTCSKVIRIDLRTSAAGQKPTLQTQTEKVYPTGEALKAQILKTVDELPPMPQTVIKAREIMEDPKAGFQELSALFEADQAIAAKILKLANSSYYGIKGGVSSIQKASVVLGQKTLRELVTLGGVSGLIGNQLVGYGLDAGDLWMHSLAVAFGARFIAEKIDASLASDAFTSGLLHDCGKLILDSYIAERWQQFEDAMADGETSFLDAERKVLALDHPEIASDVCKAWQIPKSISRAIRHHHHPSRSQKSKLAYIVHAADAIALMSGIGIGIDGTRYQMEEGTMTILALNDEDMGAVMGHMLSAAKKIVEE